MTGHRYEPSHKHCPPYTAADTRCPEWSREIAQNLLEESIEMGQKRVATRDGLPFVAQRTHPYEDIWHGYPDAWDNIDPDIIELWKKEGKIRPKDLKRRKTEEQVREAWRSRK
jgi:hypothetical protein